MTESVVIVHRPTPVLKDIRSGEDVGFENVHVLDGHSAFRAYDEEEAWAQREQIESRRRERELT